MPDGIHGAYYDNSLFDGQPRLRKTERNIDVAFSGSGPLENMAGHKYSIRESIPFAVMPKLPYCAVSGWDGFLLIPQTAHYVFSTGVQTWLNLLNTLVVRCIGTRGQRLITEQEYSSMASP